MAARGAFELVESGTHESKIILPTSRKTKATFESRSRVDITMREAQVLFCQERVNRFNP